MWILILIVVLIVCSISDIKYKTINVMVLFYGILISFITAPFYFKGEIGDIVNNIVIGTIPGILLLIVSKIGHHIGEGDGYVIITSGILAGLPITVSALIISLIISAIFGLIFIFVMKKSASYSIPFIPFYTVGFLLCLTKQIITNVPVLR